MCVCAEPSLCLSTVPRVVTVQQQQQLWQQRRRTETTAIDDRIEIIDHKLQKCVHCACPELEYISYSNSITARMFIYIYIYSG